MGSGFFSPIGMRLLNYFEIKAPLSDIMLTTLLLMIAWVTYCLISWHQTKDKK
jgi:hypothetical protein